MWAQYPKQNSLSVSRACVISKCDSMSTTGHRRCCPFDTVIRPPVVGRIPLQVGGSRVLSSTDVDSNPSTGAGCRQQARLDLPLTGSTEGPWGPATPPEGFVTKELQTQGCPRTHSSHYHQDWAQTLPTRVQTVRRSPRALPQGVSRPGQPPPPLLGLGAAFLEDVGVSGARSSWIFLPLRGLQHR